jgi:hypothetical protein
MKKMKPLIPKYPVIDRHEKSGTLEQHDRFDCIHAHLNLLLLAMADGKPISDETFRSVIHKVLNTTVEIEKYEINSGVATERGYRF